jgi:hypothetical protein
MTNVSGVRGEGPIVGLVSSVREIIMRNEKTSKRVAKIAGKVLALKGVASWYVTVCNEDRHSAVGLTWRDIRALAASCLTQAADKKKK